MLAFYMDHQFRASITKGLRARGIDVLTALDDGAATLDDERILHRATELRRVLATHDKGFLRIARQWQQSDQQFSGIVFGPQERVNIGRIIEYLELVAHTIQADEIRNRVEYIPA
jgi:hypothetical protein